MLKREDLIAISEPRDGPCISITMPTHRAGAATRENPIRFKNRLQEAEQRLEAHGVPQAQIDALLDPGRALVEDHSFWQHQRQGLAFYSDGAGSHRFLVPIALAEQTVVGYRFYLKPLIPLLEEGGYYLLAVSLKRARLLAGGRDGLEALDLPEDVPTSLEEALRFDEPVVSLQHHGRTPAGGRHEGIVHGTGDADPDRKMQILRFFRQLDNGVRKVIAGSEEPLLFMGVDYLFPLYREANHYPHLLERSIGGNPDEFSPEDLAVRGWEVMGAHFARGRTEAAQRYRDQAGRASTSDALEKIVPAALEARVDTLIVGRDVHRWGSFDAANRSVRLLGEDAFEATDLLDLAAVETLRNGGTVYVVPREEVPEGRELVAIFRY